MYCCVHILAAYVPTTCQWVPVVDEVGDVLLEAPPDLMIEGRAERKRYIEQCSGSARCSAGAVRKGEAVQNGDDEIRGE